MKELRRMTNTTSMFSSVREVPPTGGAPCPMHVLVGMGKKRKEKKKRERKKRRKSLGRALQASRWEIPF